MVVKTVITINEVPSIYYISSLNTKLIIQNMFDSVDLWQFFVSPANANNYYKFISIEASDTVNSIAQKVADNYQSQCLYNNYNPGSVNVVGNVVTIIRSNTLLSGPVTMWHKDYIDFSVSIIELTDVNILNIDILQGSNCSKVRLKIVADSLFNKIIQPVNITFADTFEKIIEVDRDGSLITVVIENSNNEQSLFNIQIPNSINSSQVSVNVINNYLIIYNDGSIDFEYSLDNINYNSNNVIANLTNGSHLLYYRDKFGCFDNMWFSVTNGGTGELDTTPLEPYIELQAENPIRLINENATDYCGEYINYNNNTSAMANVDLPYDACQIFKSCNIVTNQLKTNFKNIQFSINNNNIISSKISNNIGLKNKLDCLVKIMESDSSYISKVGIYFDKGNVLDYDTNNILSQYELGYELPEWAVYNNIILFNNDYYVIDNIELIDNIYYILLNVNIDINSFVFDSYNCGCIYNIEEFEVYETVIDFGNYIDENVIIECLLSHVNWDNKRLYSELITVRNDFKNALNINYYNENNNGLINTINTINNAIVVLYDEIQPTIDSSNSIIKTDDNVYSYGKSNYFGLSIKFEPMSEPLIKKLILALSHDNLIINGQQLTLKKIGQIKQLNRSNLQEITCQFYVKSTSNKYGLSLINDSNAVINNLLQFNNTNFIKIQ